MNGKKIIVVGGGAAGFFAAIEAAKHPGTSVLILEKTNKLLSKVKVSGGGRCNVTNSCRERQLLVKNYPRGEKELQSVFSRFGTEDTVQWFKEQGVQLITEADGRMFPESNNSETIIRCFLQLAEQLGIEIKTGVDIRNIEKTENQFLLSEAGGGNFQCDKLIMATGGGAKPEHYQILRSIGLEIQPPVPSLFTFNIPDHAITQLMGISMPSVRIKLSGSKIETEGPMLITHWGLSGPAVLKASAWGARLLNESNYDFRILVNWLPKFTEEKIRIELLNQKEESASRQIQSDCPFEVPKRLWDYFIEKAGIQADQKWADLSKKQLNLLCHTLLQEEFHVKGKTTFKEEFVTCGGVKLNQINLTTMESKTLPGLYFAGELIDVDGITGGFNFQNAWSTGYLAGKHAAE